jgi:hypothetical protein
MYIIFRDNAMSNTSTGSWSSEIMVKSSVSARIPDITKMTTEGASGGGVMTTNTVSGVNARPQGAVNGYDSQ